MANYQSSILSDHKRTPEQRLWRAVIGQVMYDLLTDYSNNYITNDEKQLAEYWVSHKHKDFVDVCRNAGFDPDYLYKRIHNLLNLKKLKKLGIVWNFKKRAEKKHYERNDNLSKV
jgi:hypothetical protein